MGLKFECQCYKRPLFSWRVCYTSHGIGWHNCLLSVSIGYIARGWFGILKRENQGRSMWGIAFKLIVCIKVGSKSYYFSQYTTETDSNRNVFDCLMTQTIRRYRWLTMINVNSTTSLSLSCQLERPISEQACLKETRSVPLIVTYDYLLLCKVQILQ